MATKSYVGIEGVSHEIKAGYIGVSGIARKIKKAYVGIDGKARLCWSSSPSAVTGLSVSGTKMNITISWTNPTDSNYYQTVVVQKIGSAPTNITDGVEIYRGTDATLSISVDSYNTTYHFAVFAVSADGAYDGGFPTGSYTTPADIYLLNGSDLCTDVTGDWSLTYSYQGYGGMSKTTDGIKIYDTSSKLMGGGVVVTQNPIDITAYKTLRVTGKITHSSAAIMFGVYSDRGSTNDTPTPVLEFSQNDYTNFNPTVGAFDYTLDVSNLTGTYYIGLRSIMNAGEYATFYTVELKA